MAVLIYATATDLAGEPWHTTPEEPEVLLRHASLLVRRVTRTAVYRTDSEGYPTDAELREAMRDATCAQAVAWSQASINPATGPAGAVATTVASKGIGSARLSYSVTAATARAQAVRELCPDAATILSTAGLLGGEPFHTY